MGFLAGVGIIMLSATASAALGHLVEHLTDSEALAGFVTLGALVAGIWLGFAFVF